MIKYLKFMKNREIKFKNSNHSYSIVIGNNLLGTLPSRIKLLCPKTKRVAIIFDRKIPNKFKRILKLKLKKYKPTFIPFNSNEKSKSFKTVEFCLNKLLKHNFNRSDLIISVGGGITGDTVGFIASIFKRGINFINIPTTLLAQVDSAIGGKTGVNSTYGKNLIGSFYQPKLVLSDTAFLKSLPKKEIICGYAEILKHAIIKDKNFFGWLKQNTKKILEKNIKELMYSIKKSCEIKIFFVNKDVHERNLRMILNFGHTFAHAIEAKNNFSKKISHGEAVLAGMILATKLSVIKKICNNNVLKELKTIYERNKLSYTYKDYSSRSKINSLIPFLKNDKKNNDDKINFILIKKIGKIDTPNKHKISIKSLKNISKVIAQY